MKLSRYAALLWCVLVGGVGITTAAQAADAPRPVAGPKDLVLKGDAKCTGCHDESDEPTPSMLELHPSVLSIATTKHGVKGDARTPTCTECHGDSEKHLSHKGKDKPPKPDRYFSKGTETSAGARSDACMSCHKGDKRTHWDGSQHASGEVTCTSCHQIHAQKDKVRSKKTQADVCFSCHKEQRADSKKMSVHPVGEGKVVCSDCHNVHGSGGPKMMKKNTVVETCWTCHAEKRGPFLFEHQPVSEDCSICHSPHGSNQQALLKTRPPFLCSECHDGPHNSKAPVGPAAAGRSSGYTGSLSSSNLGRGCVNCHSLIHGSNSPAGGYFQR